MGTCEKSQVLSSLALIVFLWTSDGEDLPAIVQLVFALSGFALDKRLVFLNRVHNSLELHSEVASSGTNVVKNHQSTEHASECTWYQKRQYLSP